MLTYKEEYINNNIIKGEWILVHSYIVNIKCMKYITEHKQILPNKFCFTDYYYNILYKLKKYGLNETICFQTDSPSTNEWPLYLNIYKYICCKINYFINKKKIPEEYTKIMVEELNTIKKFTINKKSFLSIGAGIGGLELLILKTFSDAHVSFIEKNYVSNKIRYGWDDLNREGYNDLNLLDEFLKSNEISKKRYQIFDFDKKIYPTNKFDVLLSIYSLDYQKEIGRGSFSTVYKGIDQNNNEEVAIKKINNKALSKMRNYIDKEINLMKKLDHKNIVKLYDVLYDFNNTEEVYLVLEYCSNGDLTKFLDSNGIDEKLAKNYLKQLSEGLKYLKDNNISPVLIPEL